MGEGLSSSEAAKKLESYGYNEIVELLKVSRWKVFLRQIRGNFAIYLLFGAAILSLVVDEIITSIVIFIVIIIVIVTGFAQEFRAEKAVTSLKQMIVLPITVVRDGKEREIPPREIVPGDLLVLKTGEKVPADCIVISSKELTVNEAVLTGESSEIKKVPAKNEKEHKRENELFMGTFITGGKCNALVMHTGMNTEFGKIANMVSTAERELPLQKKINRISKYMIWVAIIVSLLTGGIIILGSPVVNNTVLVNAIVVIIALSVSAIPEGLPVTMILTLATGAYRMAKKNAIVNRLSIIETLGETTVICSDKTGTITKDEMTVKKIFAGGEMYEVGGTGYETIGEFTRNKEKVVPKTSKVLSILLRTAVACNDARIREEKEGKEYSINGTPTEAALLVLGGKAGIFAEDINVPRIEEIPFTSSRKSMYVLCKEADANVTYAKGAPEVILDKCSHIQNEEGILQLDENVKSEIIKMNNSLASQAFRTIALAYKRNGSGEYEGFENNLIFLGIAALEDPPREEVKGAIEMARAAGIRVKMVTGDSRDTAIAIASQIGLNGKVMDGKEMDSLTDDELSKVVNDTIVFARVRPEHKVRIVNALKKNGEIVTMTGDGVNDAPALKESHIGVAMGKRGTDVSRETADLVLKDDNFSTIVSAVKEGRTMFSNIRKFVSYELSCNYGELFAIFVSILIGLPLPLIALQILFLNLVTDDLPSITLGLSPPEADVMGLKPRRNGELISKRLLLLTFVLGSIMGICTIAMFDYSLNILHNGIEESRTIALLTLVSFEIVNAFGFRSLKYVSLKIPFFSNRYLVYASFISVMASLAIVYTPLNKIFGTVPVHPIYMVELIGLALLILVAFDFIKVLNSRYNFLPL